MKKIFVTYGNQNYYKSLDRIKNEAVSTGEFDEILVYTDKDLPEDIKSHELMKYQRGGGYWLWKPWVVLEAMKHLESDDDIVVYSDCGNTLSPHKGWKRYFEKLKNNDACFFYNGGLMKQWTKKSLLQLGKKRLSSYYQLMGGLLFVKKNATSLIQTWYDTMRDYPDLVMDAMGEELKEQTADFIEHRHDQAVLSVVAYNLSDKYNIVFEPQTSEWRQRNGQPIFISRISDDKIRNNHSCAKWYVEILKLYVICPYRRLRTKYLQWRTRL